MYNLKTIALKTSFYDVVPIFLFLWGLPLFLYFALFPITIIYLACCIAFIMSGFLLVYYRLKQPFGLLSIKANEATLVQGKQHYKVEFESHGSWRLVANLTRLEDQEVQLDAAFIKRPIFVAIKQWLLLLKRQPTICIYHTSIAAKKYAYLRSFAAYQCFIR